MQYPNFNPGIWQEELNVRDFVLKNVSPYDGDASFLVGPTEKTKKVWAVYASS